jgi:hypothetical protein
VQSNAPDTNGSARTCRITHPFHPYHGRQFPLVTIRHNWGEDRVYYRDEGERLACIPASWTDMIPPDPVVAISAGRSPFRLQDLLELARLVEAREQEVAHDR